MLSARFSPNDRMCDIISQEFHLLQMMCRFGIPLGVSEKTVRNYLKDSKDFELSDGEVSKTGKGKYR